MPEGDTIYKLAAALRPDLAGHTLVRARLRGDGDAERLVGRTVGAVEACGKHLLMHTDDGATLRTHLRMDGAWHRYQPGERWRFPAHEARALLATAELEFVAVRMPEVELLRTRDLATHPVLSQLGPDLTHESPDLDAILLRARAWDAHHREVADLLLDQRIAAGIGNVFKSEVLFLERVHPWTSADDLDDSTLCALFSTAARWIRFNLTTRRRICAPYAEDVGSPRRGAGLWVYGRDRLPCRQCGTLIRVKKVGQHARGVWWCPSCQS